MDYSYKAIVERVRNDSLEYTGLNWIMSDNPVTRYPNLVGWMDSHGDTDLPFERICRCANITPVVLISIIVEGTELTASEIYGVCKATGYGSETILAKELYPLDDVYEPAVLINLFEMLVNSAKFSYDLSWVRHPRAVAIYYDLKAGMRPPWAYFDALSYMINRELDKRKHWLSSYSSTCPAPRSVAIK